jgi:hypothetical protein
MGARGRCNQFSTLSVCVLSLQVSVHLCTVGSVFLQWIRRLFILAIWVFLLVLKQVTSATRICIYKMYFESIPVNISEMFCTWETTFLVTCSSLRSCVAGAPFSLYRSLMMSSTFGPLRWDTATRVNIFNYSLNIKTNPRLYLFKSILRTLICIITVPVKQSLH